MARCIVAVAQGQTLRQRRKKQWLTVLGKKDSLWQNGNDKDALPGDIINIYIAKASSASAEHLAGKEPTPLLSRRLLSLFSVYPTAPVIAVYHDVVAYFLINKYTLSTRRGVSFLIGPCRDMRRPPYEM